MDPVELTLLGTVTSFAGSMLSLFIWVHLDLEGHWQHRRIRHGERLEFRRQQRGHEAVAKAARAHEEVLEEERLLTGNYTSHA